MSVSKMVQLIRVWKLASYPAKVKAGFFHGGPSAAFGDAGCREPELRKLALLSLEAWPEGCLICTGKTSGLTYKAPVSGLSIELGICRLGADHRQELG